MDQYIKDYLKKVFENRNTEELLKITPEIKFIDDKYEIQMAIMELLEELEKNDNYETEKKSIGESIYSYLFYYIGYYNMKLFPDDFKFMIQHLKDITGCEIT